MCLKTNLKARKIDLKQEFIQQCKDILEDGRLLSNLKQSKSLQKQNYNMQDLGTIEIIKLLKKKKLDVKIEDLCQECQQLI